MQLPSYAVRLNGHAGQVLGSDKQVETRALEPQKEVLVQALSLVDRLQRENMELAARVGFLQAKLETAEEQILALSTGQQELMPQEQLSVDPPPGSASPQLKYWEWYLS
jgi:hypothetical protein